MRESEWLVERFEQRRGHLRAVAYRMLGSLSEADDALQEVWLRLSRSDRSDIDNLDAWLTTVVGRVCLNMLRSRERRREDLVGVRVPDPIVSGEHGIDPADEVLLADSVGLALLVVIETLTPAERLAFVLHDMFAVSFDEIGPMVERSPAAARQLASRARRRVQGEAKVPDADLTEQQEVVDAFFAAARDGDFDRLVGRLDRDVVLRADDGPDKPPTVLRGAAAVARASLAGVGSGRTLRTALVNGAPGAVLLERGRPVSILGFTVVQGQIAEIDAIRDPERLRRLISPASADKPSTSAAALRRQLLGLTLFARGLGRIPDEEVVAPDERERQPRRRR
ncbi:MAG: sigma-70 family RNA polymerase sigma factor [Solirubrobacterales bacterium]|nr:sigma-70 family RNA polymerase sigma factor [Solirubrobacterales bacterium]